MSIDEHFAENELAILRARAERAARPVDDERLSSASMVLVVSVRDEHYAFLTDQITTVYENVPIVPVPCVPAFVGGIANIRGHIVPVLDLAALLGVPGETEASASILVVTTHGNVTAAFHIHAIGATQTIDATSLAPIPVNLDLAGQSYLQGVMPDGTALLDIPTLLNSITPSLNATVS